MRCKGGTKLEKKNVDKDMIFLVLNGFFPSSPTGTFVVVGFLLLGFYTFVCFIFYFLYKECTRVRNRRG